MIRFSLALACLLLPALAAAEAPADFSATAPITLQGDGPYYRLTLPIQANFAAHAPDLRDLRVFNSQGEAVRLQPDPRPARCTEQTEQQVPLKWFPLYAADAAPDALRQVKVDRRADGTIVSVLDAATRPPTGAPKLRGYLLDTSRASARGSDLKLEASTVGTRRSPASSSWRSRPATISRAGSAGRVRPSWPGWNSTASMSSASRSTCRAAMPPICA